MVTYLLINISITLKSLFKLITCVPFEPPKSSTCTCMRTHATAFAIASIMNDRPTLACASGRHTFELGATYA